MSEKPDFVAGQSNQIDLLIVVVEAVLTALIQLKKVDISDQAGCLVELAELIQDLSYRVDQLGLLADRITKLPPR
ncbi:hypothetical protein [Bradyrhizobium erythrophlei]|jgi:hypothetical protein|uniref:Uncharacterized protein n=1 Tax=Bradyrhizobium erythrophlei TaxID=1437360 RepID=A0A1M5S102_9BRAD|nr:hypothetical protein [Bradyrhizobium erythrophlei]SHH32134.1 hypothetical protein SAMN05444169_6881 [Bradyrhizobium erythrophlei]